MNAPDTIRNGDRLLADVHAALAQQRIEAAVDIAEEGLNRGLVHPLFLNLVAHRRQVAGRFDEALALLDQARAIAPGDVFILCAIGSVLSQQGLEPQALGMYELALRHEPRHAPAHHGRGLALSHAGDMAGAVAAHRRAIELAPDYPDALAALADHAWQAGDEAAAESYARRALANDADEPSATLTLAVIEAKRGELSQSAARLKRRLDKGGLAPLHIGALEFQLGEILDKLDRPREAFAAHVRSNAAAWALHGPQMARAGVEPGVDLCRRLRRHFEGADPADWRAAPQVAHPADAPSGHVFLMGFVRSGTTLLEQVLASHPQVTALEEMPILRGMADPWFKNAAELDLLAKVDATQADALRADYWRRVRSFGVEPAGRVFVDKNPLDVIWLPLVAKLFPQARVLIARRDPRDVVVSSFRHRFQVNALTCAFTGLERTAAFFSEIMALGEVYGRILPVNTHAHRHEDLVDDFKGQVRTICDFVGIDWVDELRDFAETAKRRDIRTPSADQVRQGLTRDGLSRWRRYAAELEPVQPILRPWVAAFGYDA